MKQPIDDRAFLARYLKPIKSEHISFNVNASFFNLTRVANNSVTQNLSRNQKTLTVSSWIGKKTGYSTTTDFSESGIKNKDDVLKISNQTNIKTFLIGESLLKNLDNNSIFSLL